MSDLKAQIQSFISIAQSYDGFIEDFINDPSMAKNEYGLICTNEFLEKLSGLSRDELEVLKNLDDLDLVTLDNAASLENALTVEMICHLGPPGGLNR